MLESREENSRHESELQIRTGIYNHSQWLQSFVIVRSIGHTRLFQIARISSKMPFDVCVSSSDISLSY